MNCAVCGTRCRPPFRAPAAELAPDLAPLPPEAAPIVGRADFQAEPDRFLRWAMIADATGQPEAAAEALLQAAWRREDDGKDAAGLRRRAAASWSDDPLRRLDILRRAGALSEAAALADTLTGLDEDQRRILVFQRARIAAGDTARHAISSVLPPSRTPHVTHVQKPSGKPGLFPGLFGPRSSER